MFSLFLVWVPICVDELQLKPNFNENNFFFFFPPLTNDSTFMFFYNGDGEPARGSVNMAAHDLVMK